MGVYVYSLRAKTVALTMPSGLKIRANLFSYAYRLSSDNEDRSYRLLVNNIERNARAAFDKTNTDPHSPMTVIVGDMSRPSGINGDAVYTGLLEPLWYDCDKFPGTFVGWVEASGPNRKPRYNYRVVDHTPWSEGQVSRDGAWVPYRSRSILVGGKIEQQMIDIGSEADIEREVQEQMAVRQ